MSYIGNSPVYQAFVTDSFSGNGSTVAFTMSVAPANSASVLVAISGVLQDPSTYSVLGTVLTFSSAPPSGTGNISVRYLGVPASNITTSAYRTLTEFTATAGQTLFTTASYTPGFIAVYLNGVMLGSADYTATDGVSVTLAVGANAGDLVATESFYVSSVVNAIQAIPSSVTATYLAAGAAYQAFLDSASGTGNGALKLPAGTTAQRPAGAPGLVRLNLTTGNPEWWDATTSTWLQFSQPAGYTVNYLVVAGGGGGGGATRGGGGGAGGVLTGTVTLSTGTAYTVVVGSGGASGPYSSSNEACAGSSGTNSSAFTQLANGGGGGGSSDSTGTGRSPSSGGSGGGGWYVQSGGSGTTGQGYAGGSGATTSPYGGGGGGAGAAGAAAGAGQMGGIGILSNISGSPTYYGGGGSSANFGTNSGIAGGLGGGGTGCNANTTMGLSPANGASNSGGGGGAAGNGGSGVVIISYLGSQRGTGGTVTSSGGYTIHTFTSSGTYNA